MRLLFRRFGGADPQIFYFVRVQGEVAMSQRYQSPLLLSLKINKATVVSGSEFQD